MVDLPVIMAAEENGCQLEQTVAFGKTKTLQTPLLLTGLSVYHKLMPPAVFTQIVYWKLKNARDSLVPF